MGMTGTQKNPFGLLVSKVLHSCKAFIGAWRPDCHVTELALQRLLVSNTECSDRRLEWPPC